MDHPALRWRRMGFAAVPSCCHCPDIHTLPLPSPRGWSTAVDSEPPALGGRLTAAHRKFDAHGQHDVLTAAAPATAIRHGHSATPVQRLLGRCADYIWPRISHDCHRR